MRKVLIVVIAIVVALVAGYYFFARKEVVFTRETSLYKAVPVSSPLFVEFNGMKNLFADEKPIKELQLISDFKDIYDLKVRARKLMKDREDIENQLASRSFVVALDMFGEDVLKPIVIGRLRSSTEARSIKPLLAALMRIPVENVTSRTYNGYDLFELKNVGRKSKLYYSIVEGMVVVSPESILVEKCIRQFNTETIVEDDLFVRVNKSVSVASDISWYINHKHFPAMAAKFLNGETTTSTNEFGDKVRYNLRRKVRDLATYARWTEMDMSVSDRGISLNGVSAAVDSLNHFLAVFNGQQAVSCKADRALPSNTVFYVDYAFSDSQVFFKKLEKYFDKSNRFYKREEKLKKMGRQFRATVKTTFSGLAKNRITGAITGYNKTTGELQSLLIIDGHSDERNEEKLLPLLKNYAKSKDVNLAGISEKYKTTDGQTHSIYQFPYASFGAVWLGEIYNFSKTRFLCFYNDQIVFGSSSKALQDYLNKVSQGMVLSRKKSYRDFRESAENRANIDVYADVNRSFELKELLLSEDLQKGLVKHEMVFRKFEAVNWQLVCDKGVFFNTLNIGLQQETKSSAQTDWKVPIGAQVANTPQLVANHRNPSEKEIIFQDSQNHLQLYSSEGKRVWNIPISGKILGKIHQVDYYRNGKLQYLFNTKDKLYLVDRLGRNVANFPVVFKTKASSGVNVFDYDNNKKYRYFVACGKQVFAYTHEGKIIDGWKFGGAQDVISNPVHHFRVNNKDYIVFKDKSRVYIQNRRGATRVESKARFLPSDNDIYLVTKGRPRMVTTDKYGTVYTLYFDGTFTEKNVGKFSSKHFFRVSDLKNNGVLDYIFADGRELKVVDENGNKVFTQKLEEDLILPPQICTLKNRQKVVGITDADDDKFYLFDANGNALKGIPLEGSSDFVLGNLTSAKQGVVLGNSEGELMSYIIE